MRVSLNWLREFVDLPESAETLRPILDDLGLVVEEVCHTGGGLEQVVVARVEEIRPIQGADRIRLVTVEAGEGPVEIVCGAMNFDVGAHVPLAPVGSVLPGGVVIAERTMRGVTSHGMLCSARELGLGDGQDGLMVLDSYVNPVPGESLSEVLRVGPDAIFDISVEGNRPDAWSIEGVARDLAARLGRPRRTPVVATSPSTTKTSNYAQAGIDDSKLCGRFTVTALRHVTVGPSPPWVVERLTRAGVRPISNVVDASNLVMLELGQPTHPYDADLVAGRSLRARRARPGELLTTLDGVERTLAVKGRGLGDTGEDCVIVDGDDVVVGLAGIMGGASSEISPTTTDVLLEAAYFDPMAIARSSKRHGLRSEASHRFERGVDPNLALRAAARFVAVLTESSPDLEWLSDPLDVWGYVPEPSTIELRDGDVERLLGVEVPLDDATSLLSALGFVVTGSGTALVVTAPTNRPDVRSSAAGRADVIEEIARLYGYSRLPRRTPSWPNAGGLTARQRLRRRLRDVVVDGGALEVWTPSLGGDDDFERVNPSVERVRVTNPFSLDESVLRATLLTGMVRAWVKNYDRGVGDVVPAEFGVVFQHPNTTSQPRITKGGLRGSLSLALPRENERATVIFGRREDDARVAVATWHRVASRLGLADVVVRTSADALPGLHPTRSAVLEDRSSGAVLGYVGEVDPSLVGALEGPSHRRLGILDLDVDALCDPSRATRRSGKVRDPSRFPSAIFDLAFVVPEVVNAQDLAYSLGRSHEYVESVVLFDSFRSSSLATNSRGLAYAIRLSSAVGTLNDDDVVAARSSLIEAAATLGAVLR